MGKIISFEQHIMSKKDKVDKPKNNMPMTVGNVVDWVNEDLDKLANNLGMTREEAYQVAQGFFDHYPALSSYVSDPNFRKSYPLNL